MPAPPDVPGFACERLLGEGAFGAVWLARETAGLRRPVALKVFGPARAAAWEREVELGARIEELRRDARAPELVQALGSGRAGELGWIALEWLEGGSLAEVVARDGPLPVARAVDAARDAARALERLHRAGLFHRDVKPQNLLLGADGRVRLGDFGLARDLDGSLSAAGSPAFAAPEVIAGRPVDGRLADIYSLGATLSFLLTGETVLPGRPDAFALERKGVPRPLTLAIVRACAADPAERTPDATTFQAALAGEFPESARTSSGGRHGGVEGAHDAPLPAMETPVKTDPKAPIGTPVDVDGPPDKGAVSVPVRPRTARSAVASLVCAILVLPVMFVAATLAMVLLRADAVSSSPQVTRTWAERGPDGHFQEFAVLRTPSGTERLGPYTTQPELTRAIDARLGQLSAESPPPSSSPKILVLVFNVLFPAALELTAIVSGILAIVWTSGGALRGRGYAIAGLVIAFLNVLPPVAVFLVVVLAR